MKEIHFIGFTYYSVYYESIYVLTWTLIGKLLPLVALSLIFIRVKHIWSFALFSPISMYLFQIIAVINEDVGSVDKIEFFYCLPFFIIYCYLLYLYKRYLIKLKAQQDYEKDLVKTGLEGLLDQENEK